MAYPSYPELRLCDDTLSGLKFNRDSMSRQDSPISGKSRIRADHSNISFCAHAIPLRKMYLLKSSDCADTESTLIQPVSKVESYIALYQQSYRLYERSNYDLKSEFQYYNNIVRRLDAFNVIYRRDLSILPDIVNEILCHAKTCH